MFWPVNRYFKSSAALLPCAFLRPLEPVRAAGIPHFLSGSSTAFTSPPPPPSAFLFLPRLPPCVVLCLSYELRLSFPVCWGASGGEVRREWKSALRVQVHGLKDTAGFNKGGAWRGENPSWKDSTIAHCHCIALHFGAGEVKGIVFGGERRNILKEKKTRTGKPTSPPRVFAPSHRPFFQSVPPSLLSFTAIPHALKLTHARWVMPSQPLCANEDLWLPLFCVTRSVKPVLHSSGTRCPSSDSGSGLTLPALTSFSAFTSCSSPHGTDFLCLFSFKVPGFEEEGRWGSSA